MNKLTALTQEIKSIHFLEHFNDLNKYIPNHIAQNIYLEEIDFKEIFNKISSATSNLYKNVVGGLQKFYLKLQIDYDKAILPEITQNVAMNNDIIDILKKKNLISFSEVNLPNDPNIKKFYSKNILSRLLTTTDVNMIADIFNNNFKLSGNYKNHLSNFFGLEIRFSKVSLYVLNQLYQNLDKLVNAINSQDLSDFKELNQDLKRLDDDNQAMDTTTFEDERKLNNKDRDLSNFVTFAKTANAKISTLVYNYNNIIETICKKIGLNKKDYLIKGKNHNSITADDTNIDLKSVIPKLKSINRTDISAINKIIKSFLTIVEDLNTIIRIDKSLKERISVDSIILKTIHKRIMPKMAAMPISEPVNSN